MTPQYGNQPMQFSLPIPAPGSSERIAPLAAGTDSLALAQLANRLTEKSKSKAQSSRTPLVIITASAFEAQRLLEEMPWFAPNLAVHLLPDWETLPYDHFSPHPDLISERLATLYQISQNACDVIIVPAGTALLRLPAQAYLAAHTFMLKKSQKLDLEALRTQCAEAGYHHVNQVMSPGEFSVRGGLVDLFPMGSALPYRLDLFDDEIETIRTFDVDTQRSVYPVADIRLLPAREFPLDEKGIALFRQNFREMFEGDPSRSRIYKDVSKGIASGGIEWYLPLFFEKTATLLDYLPTNAILCLHGNLDQAAQIFWQEAQSRYRIQAHDPERPILKPEQLLIKADDFFSQTHQYARLYVNTEGITGGLPDLNIERRAEHPLYKLQEYIKTVGKRVLITGESLGRRETMLQLLGSHDLKPKTAKPGKSFRLPKHR